MSEHPNLVPTLSELQIELEKAIGNFNVVDLAYRRSGSRKSEQAAMVAAASPVTLVSEIAHLPAASLLDLRTKAYALNWILQMSDEWDSEADTLGRQIVVGLLDDRIV